MILALVEDPSIVLLSGGHKHAHFLLAACAADQRQRQRPAADSRGGRARERHDRQSLDSARATVTEQSDGDRAERRRQSRATEAEQSDGGLGI